MAISLDSDSTAGVRGVGKVESVAPHTPTLSRHALRPAPPQADSVGTQPPVQERFWNLPNTITVLRAGVVPVLLIFPLFHGGPDGGPSERISISG